MYICIFDTYVEILMHFVKIWFRKAFGMGCTNGTWISRGFGCTKKAHVMILTQDNNIAPGIGRELGAQHFNLG